MSSKQRPLGDWIALWQPEFKSFSSPLPASVPIIHWRRRLYGNNEGGRATIWAAEAFSGPPFGRFNDGRATWIGNLNTKWLSIRHTHTPTSRRISKSDVWNYLFIHSAFIVCCSLRQTNCGSFSNSGCLAAGSLNVTPTFSDICI
jgi:hypothetical protein